MSILQEDSRLQKPAVSIFFKYPVYRIALLNQFNPNSKTAPLGLALLGMLGVGTVLGGVYAAILHLPLPVVGYRPGRREWLVAASFAGAMTLVAVVLFWVSLSFSRTHRACPSKIQL